MKCAGKFLTLIVLTVSVSACSNQMIYTLIQNNQRTECYTLPAGQQEPCLEKYQLSYTQYLNARKERVYLDYD